MRRRELVVTVAPVVLEELRGLLAFEERAAELHVRGWDEALSYFLVEQAKRAVADGRWPRWPLEDIEDVELPSIRVATVVGEVIHAHAQGRVTFRRAVAELLSRMLELEREDATTH